MTPSSDVGARSGRQPIGIRGDIRSRRVRVKHRWQWSCLQPVVTPSPEQPRQGKLNITPALGLTSTLLLWYDHET